jgi:3-hydroxymyristoyl/3-hydroxydecanoyl-(acyl carrier protein) dehydratase
MDEIVLTDSIVAESDWPWFAGHFPGNPILPGIAQLRLVIDLIARHRMGKIQVSGFSRVKFRKLVRPGDRLELQVKYKDHDNNCSFKITSGDAEVCSGKMLLSSNEPPHIHEQREQ